MSLTLISDFSTKKGFSLSLLRDSKTNLNILCFSLGELSHDIHLSDVLSGKKRTEKDVHQFAWLNQFIFQKRVASAVHWSSH